MQSIAQILGRAATTAAAGDNNNTDSNATSGESSSEVVTVGGPAKTLSTAVCVPGAFSEEPELHRRSVAAAKKLSPEEERRLRASEVQRAVSARDAGPSGGSAAGATAAAATGVAGAGAADGGGDSGAALDQSGSSTTAVTETTLSAEQQMPEVEVGPAATGTASVAVAVAVAPGLDKCVDGAPPPRRPVKVAPGVLALLTKQYSARAVAAGGGGGGGSGASGKSKASTKTKTSEGTAGPDICPPAVAPATTEATVASTAAKPISKSLAALLARKRDNDGPPPGRGSPDDACSDVQGGVCIGQKAASPPLGFLGELKAKAAARNACPGSSPSPSPSPLPPYPKLAAPAPVVMPRGERGSFLDELKARAARIS